MPRVSAHPFLCVCMCALLNVCSLFNLTFFLVCFICVIAGVCALLCDNVCISLLRVYREMKQALDLEAAVSQSHIKAAVVQPIDDQGSGPESNRRRSQNTFLRSVCVCGWHFAESENIYIETQTKKNTHTHTHTHTGLK